MNENISKAKREIYQDTYNSLISQKIDDKLEHFLNSIDGKPLDLFTLNVINDIERMVKYPKVLKEWLNFFSSMQEIFCYNSTLVNLFYYLESLKVVFSNFCHNFKNPSENLDLIFKNNLINSLLFFDGNRDFFVYEVKFSNIYNINNEISITYDSPNSFMVFYKQILLFGTYKSIRFYRNYWYKDNFLYNKSEIHYTPESSFLENFSIDNLKLSMDYNNNILTINNNKFNLNEIL